MFHYNIFQKISFSPKISQKISSKYLIRQNFKRHLMTLPHFQINNCVQSSANGFLKNTLSNYLKSSLLFYKIKYSVISDEKCWNCKQNVGFKQYICPLCGVLQPPKTDINYFELFGIPQMFDVDMEELSTKFRNLQMTFHPDKFVNKLKAELEISESHSQLVNKAYTTLKDPLARGIYLLELKKLPVNDSCSIEKEFLMSVMDKNEELECIASKNILEEFSKKNYEAVEKQIKLISNSFQHNDYKEARLNLLKLNYFLNLETKIKEKENDLFHPNIE